MGRECQPITINDCVSSEPDLPGGHPNDLTATMPGASGVFYDVTLHFQGLVESKVYVDGVDQDGYSSIVPADGFYLGGRAGSMLGTIYLIRVSSPARDYYLNSLAPPQMSSVPPPYVVDYRGVIRVEGGTTVRVVSADADCSVLRNCGLGTSSSCAPVTVPNLDPAIARTAGGQPIDGQFIGMVVESIAIVQ
jgi:hypothetical protein